jgi:hypothetical protein
VLSLGEQALTGIFPKSALESTPAGPLELIRCNYCGLVQLAHNYNLSMLYGDTYGYRSGLNQSMVRHLQGRVQKILSQVHLESGDMVLDIGSNDGTLLSAYPPDKNLLRVGMDPSAEKFRRYYPSDVVLIPEFFSARVLQDRIGARKAKVITSIAMFYDLERPLDFVQSLKEVLDTDGVWVFEQSYLPSMLASKAYDTICHEHLEYYALKQIVFIAEKLDLKIVDLEVNAVNGGSFSVTAARRGARYPEAVAEVARVLAREELEGHNTLAPLENLKKCMDSHRHDLRKLLEDLRSKGKTVYGYGASTKGNVLLQYCGIDAGLLPLIAEVNEDKFGAFTPGTGIPIVSEIQAREMRPDYFLVLPWHFREGIIEKESDFLSIGGKLIFPLPTVQVVSSSDSQRVAAS